MRAVLLMRGRRRSISRPGASARKSCMAPTPISGKIAMYRATNPMPPSQWVKLRQKSSPRGSASTSAITLEPVPVKPLVISNHEFSGSSVPDRMNGTEPRAQTIASRPRRRRSPRVA